ncbi:unnamed protein product, partial [Brassica oleracea]
MSTSLTIFRCNIFYSRINLEKFYFSKESRPIGFIGDVFFHLRLRFSRKFAAWCLGIKYFANLPIKPVYRLFPESCQMKRP